MGVDGDDMSDPTTADTIAAAFAAARHVFEDAFLPDTYELLDDVETDDDFGGRTVQEQVVESVTVGEVDFPHRGRCLLDVAGTQGREGAPWDIVTATGPYIADLPIRTIAAAHHRIRITAAGTGETREFAITEPPKRGGGFEVFTRLVLEVRDR